MEEDYDWVNGDGTLDMKYFYTDHIYEFAKCVRLRKKTARLLRAFGKNVCAFGKNVHAFEKRLQL